MYSIHDIQMKKILKRDEASWIVKTGMSIFFDDIEVNTGLEQSKSIQRSRLHIGRNYCDDEGFEETRIVCQQTVIKRPGCVIRKNDCLCVSTINDARYPEHHTRYVYGILRYIPAQNMPRMIPEYIVPFEK